MATWDSRAKWKEPILKVLSDARVMMISKHDGDNFLIEELCDNAFGVIVDKDELFALADEIKALAEAE